MHFESRERSSISLMWSDGHIQKRQS